MSVEMISMPRSEAQKKADKKYWKKIMTTISIVTKREERIGELVGLASEKTNISKNTYMISAIKSQLSHDGITIDMLPETEKYTPPLEVKQPKKILVYIVTELLEYEDEFEGEPATFVDDVSYVSSFGTVNAAKTYITKKFDVKAHPEEWTYTIYGRYIEANTKLEATNKYRDMTKEAIAEAERIQNDEDADEYPDFLNILDRKYGEPDYVEVVKYEKEK